MEAWLALHHVLNIKSAHGRRTQARGSTITGSNLQGETKHRSTGRLCWLAPSGQRYRLGLYWSNPSVQRFKLRLFWAAPNRQQYRLRL